MEKRQEKHFGDPDKSERNKDLFYERSRSSRELQQNCIGVSPSTSMYAQAYVHEQARAG